MKFNTIKFETPEAGIGLITLNRPQRLNAINLDMLDNFFALFDHLNKNEDVRVIIITGAGRGFCAGADTRALEDELRVLRDQRRHQYDDRHDL